LLGTEGVQEADALWRREDQVVAGDRRQRLLLRVSLTRSRVDPLHGDPLLRCMRAEHSGGARMMSGDQLAQLVLAGPPLPPELRGSLSRPAAGRLATAGVVVVDPRRDRALVVGLLPRR